MTSTLSDKKRGIKNKKVFRQTGMSEHMPVSDITGKYPADFLDIIQEVSCVGDKIII